MHIPLKERKTKAVENNASMIARKHPSCTASLARPAKVYAGCVAIAPTNLHATFTKETIRVYGELSCIMSC